MDANEKTESNPELYDVDDAAELINASGHVQEVDRSFGFWSICGTAITTDNAWVAGGAALVTALYNGGGPGVIYGLFAATFFYALIGASLAELASAMPTSANVYHWASVTAGSRYGRSLSFFAGWWNALAWTFGTASVLLSGANAIVAMYSLYHPEYEPQRWQIFLAFLGICLIDSFVILFCQRFLAKFMNAMGFLCIALFFITVLVCAIMPSQTGYGYASNSFVWSDWQNLTGWSSNGFVFLAGMLNGAFAVGTPDGVTHLCEEIPKPRKNIPRGILVQLTTALLTTFPYYVALLYAITSLSDVQDSKIKVLPLAAIYQQATRSNAGTCGLLSLFLIDVVICAPGGYVAASRMLWTLGRDEATPFSSWMRQVSPKWRNPFNAQLVVSATSIVLGLIYIGSQQAFNAFVGVFTIFSTLSYLMAILPHLLTLRRHVKPGPFWMPSWLAYVVLGGASAYIVVFDVIFMFPYSRPVTAPTMNYSCVMVGGITIILAVFYLFKRTTGYVGPRVVFDCQDDVMTGLVGLSKEEEKEFRLRAGVIEATN